MNKLQDVLKFFHTTFEKDFMFVCVSETSFIREFGIFGKYPHRYIRYLSILFHFLL